MNEFCLLSCNEEFAPAAEAEIEEINDIENFWENKNKYMADPISFH